METIKQEVKIADKQVSDIDVAALEAALKMKIRGEVRFDKGTRAIYATDGSNYRQVPIGVVIPLDKKDVIDAVSICNKFGAPVLSRGAGTSLAGQCCNVAVVIDMSKYYNKFLGLDLEKKLVRVQPGIILDSIREKTLKFGLTFGPDPSTHNHCTIGGMMGNNSCGVHSVMAVNEGLGARTSDNVESLEILTYDGIVLRVGKTSPEELERIIAEGGSKGKIYETLRDLRDKYADEIRRKFPKIPRRVSGYNLDDLLPERDFNVARALIGSEGTCVIILEATLNLIPNPPARSLLVLGFPEVYDAGHCVPAVMKHQPIGVEGLDHLLIDYMVTRHMHVEDLKLFPDGKGWLLVEFGGKDKNESDEKAKKLMQEMEKSAHPPTMKLYDDPQEEEKLWKVRESGLGATAFVPGKPDAWPGWEDSAVHPDNIGDYLKDLYSLMGKHGYEASLYGHFGQGLIHCRINFDLVDADGLKNYRAFLDDATALVLKYNGSLSGEHGDGQSRAELLPKMFGPEIINAFREFKSIWDPQGKMNPGKVVDPFPILSNLRLGKDYEPWQPETHFKYPADNGSFSRAVLRCVGVGLCRKDEGGTMCPSYMVTKEEQHTTRGRAHALFEMLNGEVINKGWKDESVKETLDLCLSCKGCKGDCPVHVDIATYKAEFLSHYYEGRLRPIHAYVFGMISVWSAFASLMPKVANFMMHAPGIADAVKALIGVAPQRTMPKFAEQTFKQWFRNRQPQNVGKSQVILWADTFNNHFLPRVAIAAVEVLEDAGYEVIVPQKHLCCGRPLYDYGMLDLAKQWLLEILDALKDPIRNGVPMVGLEPSCVTVFKDEMMNLFPSNEDAKRLFNQTFLLSEFLEKKATHYQIPEFGHKALVHGHCHHKAVMKMKDEISVLGKMGVDCHMPDSGCCGMAGAFGYEKKHYDVSMKAGNRVLLPEVRKANDNTIIITDGFSCREQISQSTNREAFHLAEVLQMAIHAKKGIKAKGPFGVKKKKSDDKNKLWDKVLDKGKNLEKQVEAEAELILSNISIGMAAGLLGTAAISLSMMIDRKLTGKPESDAPAEAAGKVLGVQASSQDEKKKFSGAVHWGYGTAWGISRSALGLAGVKGWKASCIQFAAIWGTSMVMLPALKLTPQVQKKSAKEIIIDCLHHALYAAVCGAAYDRMSRSPNEKKKV